MLAQVKLFVKPTEVYAGSPIDSEMISLGMRYKGPDLITSSRFSSQDLEKDRGIL